jgi:hypothetical protein
MNDSLNRWKVSIYLKNKLMAMFSVKDGDDFIKSSSSFYKVIAMIWKYHRHDFFCLSQTLGFVGEP